MLFVTVAVGRKDVVVSGGGWAVGGGRGAVANIISFGVD